MAALQQLKFGIDFFDGSSGIVANEIFHHHDVAWLLASPMGGYLVTDTEDDTTVYRLFHDMLRVTLRERWRELLEPPATPS